MKTKHITLLTLLLLFFSFTYGQRKFKVVVKETINWKSIYSLVDEQGEIIIHLDTARYYTCFTNDEYGYFAIFGKKGSPGWVAIDAAENELFKVYNTSFGEPAPDYLIENKIRIIDENKKIGFANYKGEIIIFPRFEIASAFHNGKAIIGQKCTMVPWNKHAKESDCQHYSINCMENGYIDEKGKIIRIGNYSFDEIMKEIGWKAPD